MTKESYLLNPQSVLNEIGDNLPTNAYSSYETNKYFLVADIDWFRKTWVLAEFALYILLYSFVVIKAIICELYAKCRAC